MRAFAILFFPTSFLGDNSFFERSTSLVDALGGDDGLLSFLVVDRRCYWVLLIFEGDRDCLDGLGDDSSFSFILSVERDDNRFFCCFG